MAVKRAEDSKLNVLDRSLGFVFGLFVIGMTQQVEQFVHARVVARVDAVDRQLGHPIA